MPFLWKTIEFVSVCLALVSIILLTVGGNLVVLFAFFNDPHLLTPSNNFLLSMAIADLLVGLIGMPFYSYAQLQKFWPFGELFCKIWVTIDDVVTMASVLSIVAITIERYWSINHSVHYRRYTTKTRIRLFSLLIWLIPILNFAPGIWLLDSHDSSLELNSSNSSETFECIGAYHSHTIYLIIAQINFFAWPLAVIIVLNALIVINLYKRSHRFPVYTSFRVQPPVPIQRSSRKSIFRGQRLEEDEQQQQQHDFSLEIEPDEFTYYSTKRLQSSRNNNGYAVINRPSPIKEIDETSLSHRSPPISPPSTTENDSRQPKHLYKYFQFILLPTQKQLSSPRPTTCSTKSTQTTANSPIINDGRSQSIFTWRRNSTMLMPNDVRLDTTVKTIKTNTGEQRAVRRLRRDKRAATSLFILVLVFMIFLLPYVVVVVVGRTFSIKILTDTNSQVYSAAFWLLWLNSTVNPILYPFIQPRFREAYRKLFVRLTRRRTRLFALLVDIQRNK